MSKAGIQRSQNQLGSFSLEDRRFRQYLAVGVSVFFLVSSIVPFLHVEEKSREEQEKLPPQLTEFILKKKAEPQVKVVSKPKIVEQKIEEKPKLVAQKKVVPKPVSAKPAPKKTVAEKKIQPKSVKPKVEKPLVAKKKRKIKATQAERATARAQASEAGVLALHTGLAQLTSRHVKTSPAQTIGRVRSSGKPQVDVAMAAVSQGRSGARVAVQVKGDAIASVNIQHSTEVIAKAELGSVLADAGATHVASSQGSLSQGTVNGTAEKSSTQGIRDESSIRKIFEKNKSAIYSIYARAQRKNEDLAGKLVLEINITSEGRVAGVQLIDSELNDEKVEKKIMTRIHMFKFGEQNVAALKMRYTFDFVAS